MHRLDLAMVVSNLLERTDGKHFSARAGRKEHDGRIEKFIDLERMGILGWASRATELQVPLDQPPDAVIERIRFAHLKIVHDVSALWAVPPHAAPRTNHG
jgi:hypothetical protein